MTDFGDNDIVSLPYQLDTWKLRPGDLGRYAGSVWLHCLALLSDLALLIQNVFRSQSCCVILP